MNLFQGPQGFDQLPGRFIRESADAPNDGTLTVKKAVLAIWVERKLMKQARVLAIDVLKQRTLKVWP